MPLLNDDAGGWPWIFVVRMVWCGMIEVCEGAPAYTHGKRCQIASTVVGPRVSVSGGVALVSRPKHAVIPRMAELARSRNTYLRWCRQGLPCARVLLVFLSAPASAVPSVRHLYHGANRTG
jgi:hypothetical protein